MWGLGPVQAGPFGKAQGRLRPATTRAQQLFSNHQVAGMRLDYDPDGLAGGQSKSVARG